MAEASQPSDAGPGAGQSDVPEAPPPGFVALRGEFLSSVQNIAPTIASEEDREILLELAERIPVNPERDLGTVAPDRASRLKATVQSTQDLMEAMFQLAEQKQTELSTLLGTLMNARRQLSDAEQALLDDQLLVAQLKQRNEQVNKDLVDANEVITVNEYTIEAKLAEIKILTDVVERHSHFAKSPEAMDLAYMTLGARRRLLVTPCCVRKSRPSPKSSPIRCTTRKPAACSLSSCTATRTSTRACLDTMILFGRSSSRRTGKKK